MSYVRTPEHKAMRATLIRRWRPWDGSTGPKSQYGKVRSAMRGFKGGERAMMRELARSLKQHEKQLLNML